MRTAIATGIGCDLIDVQAATFSSTGVGRVMSRSGFRKGAPRSEATAALHVTGGLRLSRDVRTLNLQSLFMPKTMLLPNQLLAGCTSRSRAALPERCDNCAGCLLGGTRTGPEVVTTASC
jgi:hypothetical protein